MVLLFPEDLLRLIPGGGPTQDVHHELGGDHEGVVCAEALGHQARPGQTRIFNK